MNKRFFTLMAAVLLAGAPLCNEAFAYGTPEMEVATDANTGLASGMQFYISNGTTDGSKYLKVTDGDEDGTFYTVTTTTDKSEAAKFEIKSYSGGTFQLWVGGKRVYQDSGKTKGVFYALNSSGATTKLDFTNIKTYAVGQEGENLCSDLTTFAPYTKQLKLDAQDLNANLSNKGFAFQFPDANSAPESNPFGQKMVAVSASTVASALSLTAPVLNTNGLMFAIADANGNKLLSDLSVDNIKAATFVVVSPSANYGITGFDKASGEGYGFTTVKGSKLADSNKAADGKIALDNGVFAVTEEDMLAEEGMYSISASIKVNTASSETSSNLTVYVGAYSLNAGGIKTYITTKSNAENLIKASTNGTTYAQAADLLSSEGVSIYNISFCGTMPETKQEADASYYGKYLTSDIDVTSTPKFDFNALAPADVNVKEAQTQWVVTDFTGKGVFTFANLESGLSFSAKLYTTDEAGVYDFSTSDFTANGTEKVRLSASTGIENFLTLTDAQLKQGAAITFHGEGSVNVNDVYMDLSYKTADQTWHVVPSTEADDNTTWSFVKAGSVKKKLDYAYLKNGVVTAAQVDTLETPTYFLTLNGWDLKNMGTTGAGTDYQLVEQTTPGTPAGDRFAFKQYDGDYVIYAFASTPAAYANIVKANPDVMFLNKKNAQFVYNTAKRMDVENAYAVASVDFFVLGESLPAVSRHATINSEDGAVAFKENKNGILEGIIASEGMTFWLDTADTDADMPTFYLSKGIAVDTTAITKAYSDEERNFMLYPADLAYYWSDEKATYVTDKTYYLEGTNYTNLKAIFSPAALVAEDTLSTAAGVVTKKNGLNNYKYYITKYGEGYIVSPAANQNVFLYNLNGKLGFTTDLAQALVVTLGEGDATANEAIEAESNVQVIGGQGVVTVQGAAGKVITVANILGQTIANQVAASDNVTIAAPAGIVVVAVDGEATKVIVK